MVQDWCPRHSKPTVSFSCEVCRSSLFPLLALWGNKNWPPSIKVKKFEIFRNKRGSTCCKCPNLNTPGTQTPQYHPIPELTKPNLTPQQSRLPLHFDSFHPLLSATAHTTAIFSPLFLNFDFRFRLLCLWENSSKFSHAPRSRLRVVILSKKINMVERDMIKALRI